MSWLLLLHHITAAQEIDLTITRDNDPPSLVSASTATASNDTEPLPRHFNISGTALCEASTLFNSSVEEECLELAPCCDWQDGGCVSTVSGGVCSVVCDTDSEGCAVERAGAWSAFMMIMVGAASVCWCIVCVVQSLKWLHSVEDDEGHGTKQACVLLLLLLLLVLPLLVHLDEKLALVTGLNTSLPFNFTGSSIETSGWPASTVTAVGGGLVCSCAVCGYLVMRLRSWQAPQKHQDRARGLAHLVARDSRDSASPADSGNDSAVGADTYGSDGVVAECVPKVEAETARLVFLPEHAIAQNHML
jgi:hypothetical protein